MQFNREADKSLRDLPNKHIDCGMGLERLCAVKNGSISNFNTDLFMPIFDEICRTTGVPEYKGEFKSEVNTKKKRMNTKFSSIDTAYRIVGDHTRMVAACLSDGFLPDTNHRLKEVIRRSLQVIEKNFALVSQLKCTEVRNIAKTERQKNNGNFLLFSANQSQFFRPPYLIHLNYNSNHPYDHFFPTFHTPMKYFQN
mgnify:CR=1 FL=1